MAYKTSPLPEAGMRSALLMVAVAMLVLFAPGLLPQAAQASDPPGPCEDGYVAPTPTAVAVTEVPIEVASTTADYFVLYIEIDNVFTVSANVSAKSSIPISVTRGEDGVTTLVDNLSPLGAAKYRVEKYAVAQPADIDGDCVDDLTELADPGNYNPINPAKVIDRINGAVTIDSLETFQELSFNGESLYADINKHYRNLEFTKYMINDLHTDNPITYFLNANTSLSHATFGIAIDLEIPANTIFARGTIVYHPDLPAPDGSLGIYRFSFDNYEDGTLRNVAKINEVLAASMPYLDNQLFYYPVTSRQLRYYQQQKDAFDASRINVLREEDILAEVDFIPFNQAEGYGRLRLMEDGERPSPFDVAIYQTLPNDLPRVAGTITTVPQTPLSHVNLRAIQSRLPNAFIRDALEVEAIASLLDSYVYYAVTADGYTIRAATKAEVDAHHESLRPQNTQTLQHDLTVTEIAALADVSFDDWTAFGVKAANVAELTTLSLPDGTTPVGFAVPFYFYDAFMKQATVAEETVLGKKKAPDAEKITLPAGTTLASAVTQMLAHQYFQSDADIQEEMLDDLRDAIKDAASPQFIIDALTAMHAEYPDGQSLRYRSSTNNEDLPSFNGAGLYSSKTQDPDETADDGIDKSIKGVWASLWNYRAFLERDFHRVDHTTVYMGVLVHPNYSDERVNGVAVSHDPITFQKSAYYVNSQMGEDLVTNPEANSQPEQLLLGATGGATVLSRSTLAPSDKLLMTEAQMRQLRSTLQTIHNHFKTLYGVQDGDDYAIEIEFKITAENRLAIKQARPWIFAEPLVLTPTVTIALSASQAPEGAGLELTVTRAGGVLSTPLTVDLTWSETGAMLASTLPAEVTIPANQPAATLSGLIDDDSLDEHDSVVTVSIAASSRYEMSSPASASATVTDDDLTQIAVRANAGTVTEGATADFTFTRSGSVLEQPLTVPITVTESGSRLTGTLPTEVTFAANTATSSVSLTTADDSVFTSASVVTAQVTAGSAYDVAGDGSARVTVSDDEVPGPEPLFAAEQAVSDQAHGTVALNVRRGPGGDVSFSMSGPDTGLFTLYGSFEILVFNAQAYDTPRDADGDGVYEIDLEATNSRGGSTTVRMRFVVTTPELVARAAELWDQTSADQRATLLPDESSSRLRPAFASLEAEVQAIALRLARQGQLPTPGPTVSVTGGSGITEGGIATFTVTASPAPAARLDVSVAVSQSGEFGVLAGPRVVTIPTTGSAQLTVATSDDQTGESDGSVTATVSRGTGYLVSWTAGAATVAVADDDGPPPSTMPEVSITGGGAVTEGGGATFTVTADPAPTADLDITVVVTRDGDHGVTPGSQTVTIPATGSATLTVATSDDGVDEADGAVTATVSAGPGYIVSTTAGAATVAVADDDVPEISIVSNGDVTEGGNATFALTASPAPHASLAVTIAVSQSGDFGVSPGSQTVTIPATGSATLTVATTNDGSDEADGSVTATVSAGQGYSVSTTAGAATVAVADDDVPAISIVSHGDVTEGGDATFTLTASPAPHASLAVTIAVSQSGDFGVSPGSQTVTIPATGSATLTVATSDDGVDEADGAVTATVSAGSGYTVSSTAGAATVAVADDDDTPAQTCTLPSDALTVPEVETWRDEYNHDTHVSRWNRVLAALDEDTGEEPMTAEQAREVKSRIDNSRWDRTVRTLDALEKCAPSKDTTEPPATPEVSISGGSGITEGGNASFTLTASPAPAADLDVTVAVAQSGDYGVATGSRTVTIPTSGSYTLTVATTNDSADEPDGSVTVTLSAGSGYTVSSTAGAATVAVSDDDLPATPEVSIAAGSGVSEGDSATFTVTASPAPTSPLAVTLNVAQSGDFGVATGSRTVTIPTSGSYTLTVATADDSKDESDGSVTVTVSSGTGYDVSSTEGAATVAVSDDDAPPAPPKVNATPSLSISDATGTEGDTITFTVTLSPSSSRYVWVHYYARPVYGQAISASFADFGSTYGMLTFKPGETTKTITVTLVDDSTAEGDETFRVVLYSNAQAKISDGEAVGTIIDND